MMMKAPKLGWAGAGKEQCWIRSRTRKGRSRTEQEQSRNRNRAGAGQVGRSRAGVGEGAGAGQEEGRSRAGAGQEQGRSERTTGQELGRSRVGAGAQQEQEQGAKGQLNQEGIESTGPLTCANVGSSVFRTLFFLLNHSQLKKNQCFHYQLHFYLVGYGVPMVVVATAAILNPSGYGHTDYCWLTTENYFHLSFIVPVALIILVRISRCRYRF